MQQHQLTSFNTMAFRASAVASASKKPSIGDAVTILQAKVSGISQVVSIITKTVAQMAATKHDIPSFDVK